MPRFLSVCITRAKFSLDKMSLDQNSDWTNSHWTKFRLDKTNKILGRLHIIVDTTLPSNFISNCILLLS